MRMTIIIVILLVASPAFAQFVPADLQKARDQIGAVTQAGDAEGWSRMVTDDLYWVGPDGTVRSKAERMAAIKAGAFKGATLADEKIRVFGDVAIATAEYAADSGSGRFIEVWVKQGGHWKLAATQVTSLQK